MTALLSTDYADYTERPERKRVNYEKAQTAQEQIGQCPFVLSVPFCGQCFSFCVICVICRQLLVSARGSVTLLLVVHRGVVNRLAARIFAGGSNSASLAIARNHNPPGYNYPAAFLLS